MCVSLSLSLSLCRLGGKVNPWDYENIAPPSPPTKGNQATAQNKNHAIERLGCIFLHITLNLLLFSSIAHPPVRFRCFFLCVFVRALTSFPDECSLCICTCRCRCAKWCVSVVAAAAFTSFVVVVDVTLRLLLLPPSTAPFFFFFTSSLFSICLLSVSALSARAKAE